MLVHFALLEIPSCRWILERPTSHGVPADRLSVFLQCMKLRCINSYKSRQMRYPMTTLCFQNNDISSNLSFMLVNRFATAIRYLQPGLQSPTRVHETPLVFPFLPLGIKLHLPRFVKCLKPAGNSISFGPRCDNITSGVLLTRSKWLN